MVHVIYIGLLFFTVKWLTVFFFLTVDSSWQFHKVWTIIVDKSKDCKSCVTLRSSVLRIVFFFFSEILKCPKNNLAEPRFKPWTPGHQASAEPLDHDDPTSRDLSYFFLKYLSDSHFSHANFFNKEVRILRILQEYIADTFAK